jgi:hypothetical protein
MVLDPAVTVAQLISSEFKTTVLSAIEDKRNAGIVHWPSGRGGGHALLVVDVEGEDGGNVVPKVRRNRGGFEADCKGRLQSSSRTVAAILNRVLKRQSFKIRLFWAAFFPILLSNICARISQNSRFEARAARVIVNSSR